jgi:cell division ATPase FtsA
MFKRKNNTKYFYIADLGHTHIDICLCERSDENSYSVLEIVSNKLDGVELFSEQNVEIISESFNYLKETSGLKVKNVVWSVRSVNGSSFVNVTKMSRGRSDSIKKEEIDRLYDETVSNASLKIQDALVPLRLVYSDVLRIKVDSKVEENPMNLHGENIELVMQVSYEEADLVKKIRSLSKALKLNFISVVPSDISIIDLCRVKNPNIDCVLVDIGYKSTSLSIVFGGGIVKSLTFPIGGDHFTEEISLKLGVPFSKAEQLKSGALKNQLTETEVDLLSNTLDRSISLWLSGLELVLKEFDDLEVFPGQFYLTGKSVHIPGLEDHMKNTLVLDDLEFYKDIKAEVLNINKFDSINLKSPLIDSIDHFVCLSLVSIYDNFVIEND